MLLLTSCVFIGGRQGSARYPPKAVPWLALHSKLAYFSRGWHRGGGGSDSKATYSRRVGSMADSVHYSECLFWREQLVGEQGSGLVLW